MNKQKRNKLIGTENRSVVAIREGDGRLGEIDEGGR